MRPSEWARQQVEALVRHHRLVWVEDPYRLLEAEELQLLREKLTAAGHELFTVTNAFRLREELADRDPAAARLVLVDQSITPRDPHLLPRDAKPSDLRPLPAPDWKPWISTDSVFRPTIRDFLSSITGDDRWPAEVNIYPFEMLARKDPNGFLRSYDSFVRSGRPLTTEDLVLVAAGAILGVDLQDISDPITALRLAFHTPDKWDALAEHFNGAEIELIRRRLQNLPQPLGGLFGPNVDQARLAVTSLLVLRQHFPEPGRQLPILSPSLARYHDCNVGVCLEPPSWFIEDEVPRFEKLVGPEFRKYLQSTLALSDPASARDFVRGEKFSKSLRSLAPFEIESQLPEATARTEFSLDRLVPAFREAKRELMNLLGTAKGALNHLRMVPPRARTAAQTLEIFVNHKLYRMDRLLGQLNGLIRDIEGPARRQWQGLTGFEVRWQQELRDCRDAMAETGELRDDLDYEFGKLLEVKYTDIVPSEVWPADLFYKQFIGPRRRRADGGIRKAVILVIDSMRLDLWRDLIRPILEKDHVVEETIGFARLPSETRISRRAFFAGKSPGELPPSGPESTLFAAHLLAIHGKAVSFQEVANLRPGMRFAVQSPDGLTFACVFDFPDRLAHEVDWDPHTIQGVLKPLIREIQAVLSEAGPDALIFVTADHGHIRLQGGSPVYLEGVEDVGYRSAYVEKRLDGPEAIHVFQIPAKTGCDPLIS